MPNALEFLVPYLPYFLITSAVWLTYHYTLKCGFVSDDIPGLAEYDGKLQGFEYGMLWRWVRYHICGGESPSQHRDASGNPIPQGKVPSRHHFLSILVFNITCLVTQIALTPILGSKIALMSILILIVHPCTTQGVAWISGLAYPLSLFWISITLILMQYFYLHQTLNQAIWVIPIFCLIQFFAIHAIFATTALIWILLLFMGYWQFSILSFLLSFIMCFDQIRKTVNIRVEEFKKQHMGQSTVVSPRKFIVAMKTFWYYFIHAITPIRLGLYHEWGFHYERPIELANSMFWKGFSLFVLSICLFINLPCQNIKFGILWFIIFSTGFWNWITAQQFVTERYIMVANLGIAVILSTLTQNYLWLYTLILGLYLSRTWCHLPTYDNELRFYQSNTWNFQKSEVALGNLGVTYARAGMEDTAKDIWAVATNINPDYDVPWVNIFYQFRSKGQIMIQNGDYLGGLNKMRDGLPFLERALKCRVCHFPEQWRREYLEVADSIRNPQPMLESELARLIRLRDELKNRLSKTTDSSEISGITLSINNNESQMEKLVELFISNKFTPKDPALFNIYHTSKLLSKMTRR